MKYNFYFKISPNLPSHAQSYLPEDNHIRFTSPNQLVIGLDQKPEESNEALKEHAEWEIKRELLRINVLEGILYEHFYLYVKPKLSYRFRGKASAGWIQRPINPELATCQDWMSASTIETKLVLWEQAQIATNPRLIYAYLNMICEISGVDMDWQPQSGLEPTPIQEIKIIRNLLLHSKNPHPKVKIYLEKMNFPLERTVENSQYHLKLGLDRLYIVLPAVWNILMNDLGYGA